MPAATIPRGNVSVTAIVSISITPAAVATITTAEQTFTVRGLLVNDAVSVYSAAAQTTGVGIVNARVSATDTLAIQFVNPTAGSVTPVAGTYLLTVTRSENPTLSTNAV